MIADFDLFRWKIKKNNILIIPVSWVQSEYKFFVRKITIFSNLWDQNVSVLKKRRLSERASIDNYTWFKYHPYAEWYMNTHRIKGSPSSEFHRKHFGKLSYLDAFVPRFNKAKISIFRFTESTFFTPIFFAPNFFYANFLCFTPFFPNNIFFNFKIFGVKNCCKKCKQFCCKKCKIFWWKKIGVTKIGVKKCCKNFLFYLKSRNSKTSRKY